MFVSYYLHFTCRRAALHIWKQRLGSDATYQKLIDVFECAGYRTYVEIVRNTVCDAESETDDSSDYEEPIPQPETYPHPKAPSLPKLSPCKPSSRDEYLLVNPATAQGLPEGENCTLHTQYELTKFINIR